MKMLTDEEIASISESCQGADWAYQLVRKTESAALEKLKAQEPTCWTNETELSYSQFKRPDGELTSGSFWAEYHEDCDIPLYEHPLPPDDVVRDAERYRWLVGEAESVQCRFFDWETIGGDYGERDKTLDAAIDAAMGGMK